jgi:hypothetical protein
MPGLSARTSGGSSWRIFWVRATKVGAQNGLRRVRVSKSVTPSE